MALDHPDDHPDDPSDGSEQSSVGGLQLGPRRLAAQHGELVTQNEDFQILGGVAADQQDEERHRVR
jgi:hypothetical protein